MNYNNIKTFGKSVNNITHPGGCAIGRRPIDIHIKSLKKMGVNIDEALHGYIDCEVDDLKGADIHLDFPSVGATQNIMMAAVFATGETCIRNAAKEPEIVDLQSFLNKMGAKISGAGTSLIRITGVNNKLTSVEHSVISDRVVAGTYIIAAAISKGDIKLTNVQPEHLVSVISNLRDTGCHINIKRNTIRVSGIARPKNIDIIRTLPYPGFPTDMQAQFMSLLTIARGTSIMVETVFENRYMFVDELCKMGANIRVDGRTAVINGVKKLYGANVEAKDLRGGAALILSGLFAEGETVVTGINHIDRGYENIEGKLSNVGALIRRE